MEVVDNWKVVAADGCKIRIKNPQSGWGSAIALSYGGLPLEDYFEEWTDEQIENEEQEPTKREQYECLCCEKIRESYTENQENAIQNEFAMANHKLAMNAELTAEDNTAIANMKSFRDYVDDCKHAAHIEIYGEE